VTIERDDGRTQNVRIVGQDEADPVKGLLSYVSPLARALLGKRVGAVNAPSAEGTISRLRMWSDLNSTRPI
jgi:transcription elongation GreA/GreB family factor